MLLTMHARLMLSHLLLNYYDAADFTLDEVRETVYHTFFRLGAALLR